MIKFAVICLVALAMSVTIADSYAFDNHFVNQPSLFLGADVGYFRISLTRFEELYESRWGPVYGAHGGMRIYSKYYLTGKLYKFARDGKPGLKTETGKNAQLAKWREQWFTVGVRMHTSSYTKWNSFYGFGYAFFEISEQAGLTLFNNDSESPKTGGGFYLELGIQRYLFEKASAFIELEITSAGVGGRAALEGQSIGGYNFIGGVTVWLF